MDYLVFSGPIERGTDLNFIEFVDHEQNSETVTLIIVTPGGSPDAAFKMGRYLQSRYKHISVLIPGLCKSAGTLMAIAAHEVVFTPYGELGPLDVQMAKEDKLLGMESGLNTSEAFVALEARARNTFHDMVTEIVGSSGGVVSFQTASKCATDLVAALYGPIFAGIDPEEVGSRSRAMRIGEDYGLRLNLLSKNLKENAIERLAQTYPSHSFVIDCFEAQSLFVNVRYANDIEAELVRQLGEDARFPTPSAKFTVLKPDQDKGQSQDEPLQDLQDADEAANANAKSSGSVDGDGRTSGTTRKKKSSASG